MVEPFVPVPTIVGRKMGDQRKKSMGENEKIYVVRQTSIRELAQRILARGKI